MTKQYYDIDTIIPYISFTTHPWDGMEYITLNGVNIAVYEHTIEGGIERHAFQRDDHYTIVWEGISIEQAKEEMVKLASYAVTHQYYIGASTQLGQSIRKSNIPYSHYTALQGVTHSGDQNGICFIKEEHYPVVKRLLGYLSNGLKSF